MKSRLCVFLRRAIHMALLLALLLCIWVFLGYFRRTILAELELLLSAAPWLWAALGAAAVLAAGAIVVLLWYIDRVRHISWVLFFTGTALSLAAALVLSPPLQSDFLMLYDAAVSFRHGSRDYTSYVYFTLWGYQSAYVAWEAALLSLWEDPHMIQMIHCLLFSGTIVLLYRLFRPFASEKTARMTALCTMVFPTAFTLPAVLTNQIPGAFFLVLGVYVLCGRETRGLKLWRFPLSGVLLQLGNLLRPEAVLVLGALAVAGLLWTLSRRERRRDLLFGGLLLLASYFLVGKAARYLTIWSGLNPVGLVNANPLWKVVSGLNPETGGMYSNYDWYRILDTLSPDGHVTEATLKMEWDMITYRLQMPIPVLGQLVLDKIENLWVNDALYLATSRIKDGSWSLWCDVLRGMDRLMALLAVAAAALGAVLQWRTARPAVSYLPHLVVLASFCAFLLIEVQPRYAYLPYLFLFWCAGFGAEALGKRLHALMAVNKTAKRNLQFKSKLHPAAAAPAGKRWPCRED